MTDENLSFMVNHVFLPPKLPQEDDLGEDEPNEHTLCEFTYQSAVEYQSLLTPDRRLLWAPILTMLENLSATHKSYALSDDDITRSMTRMRSGDILAFLIRAQNAGIILRKFHNETVFESFEVSPSVAVVMGTQRKLLCSYPGPAIAVPQEVVDDPLFRKELTSFLVQMNVDNLDSAPTTRKARSDVAEERETAHPRYITQLLTEILRGMGKVAEVVRIRKRIADDVLWDNAFKPWRRSPLWLVIRVALQTSLYRCTDQHTEYKIFMIFMMGRMLQHALEQSFSGDLLFCMRAKMSRRLYKLGSAAPSCLSERVHHIGYAVEKTLQERWTKVQDKQAASPHWAPRTLDIASDTRLSLSNSKAYLSKVLRGEFSGHASNLFNPQHIPRFLDPDAFCDYSLWDAFKSSDSYVALADFEMTVQHHLDDWITDNLHCSTGCTTIATCITKYAHAALTAYASNPEDLSVMLLTIFDLWVGLDKMAVAQCPLLEDYSPEIRCELLDSLLLRTSRSFTRLAAIEKYLRERHDSASFGSIFRDDPDCRTFAVRYFDSSDDHQSLKRLIEDDATSQRQRKLDELESLNARHRDLKKQSKSLEHDDFITARGYKSHCRWCYKCRLQKEADGLRIEVHEWPLPCNTSEAKTVVFELRLPTVFDAWRTTTYKVLYDICTPPQRRPAISPPVELRIGDYIGYSAYIGQTARITLASTAKSFLNSHYSRTHIPSTESSVCLENALRFRLFDKVKNTWAAHPFANCSISQYCTLQLPKDGPYEVLQYAVDGTSHTSNFVMANQSDCPADLNLHEYIAFGSLRSGPRLQWLNIARELPTRALSFQKEAVNTLLMQAAWQIGPISDAGIGEWHVELNNAEFGLVLLNELEAFLLSIEANWLEGVSMRTIIALTSRLLASANDTRVIERAYTLLRKARDVTFEWTHQLADKLRHNEDECLARDFQSRLCEMAATCRATYDVDPNHAARLLDSANDIAVLMECAILVYGTALRDGSPDFNRLLDRDRRLSHSLETLLRQRIQQYPEGLNNAIAAIWTMYHPGCKWVHLEPPNDRWVTTKTAVESGQMSQHVQLNLLEGRLLINGLPLDRLPPNYVNDSDGTYSRILGKKLLDVIPADIPGMTFATRDLISDYQILFGMRSDGTTLVIRTRRGSEILEFVPHHKLIGDLPTVLVKNHTHWLNITTGEIELRPIENLWQSSTDNWRVYFSTTGDSTMRKGSITLVDTRSATMNMLSARLSPLEYREFLTVTFLPDDQSLSIELPRLRLSFFLNNEWDLESRNMPGMLVDLNQSTGTMFGLCNQLVLCAKDDMIFPRSRRVLIPFGTIVFEPCDDHILVTVDTRSQRQVRYQEYNIDADLGRLIGNVSLISKLYKIYLHAVSSYCLPDPLTGRTGTQEALYELRSAACLSFQTLGADDLKLLTHIRSLTPNRSFYPAHLQVMQNVTWSLLHPTAQHHDFFTITQSIMTYAGLLRALPGQSKFGACDLHVHATSQNSLYLLERAAHRNSVFHPAEFSGPLLSSDKDAIHTSRDLSTEDDAENPAFLYNVAAKAYRWDTRMMTTPRLLDELKSWRSLSGHVKVKLVYSREWFQRVLSEMWIPLYNLCRECSRDENRFQLAFSLSSMAYGSNATRSLIPTILAFATAPQFRTLHPPPFTDYDLFEGFEYKRERILDIVLSSAISFEESTQVNLPPNPGEDAAAAGRRRYSTFQTLLKLQAEEFTQYLDNEWPSEEPSSPAAPSVGSSWLFHVPTLLTQARKLFRTWYRNVQFRDHVEQVQAALNEVYLSEAEPAGYHFAPCSITSPSASFVVTTDALFRRYSPQLSPLPRILGAPKSSRGFRSPTNTTQLHSLLSEFQDSQANAFHRRYGTDLDGSRQSLDNETSFVRDCTPHSMGTLVDHGNICRAHLQVVLTSIRESLSPSNVVERALFTAGLWPRTTATSLLSQLAFGSTVVLTNQWREVLTSLARAVLFFQRSQRLINFRRTKNDDDFFKELENDGHDVLSAIHYADWLLIQIEGNFLARSVQIEVADQMISPKSGHNTALQLNMGEGKSSVIVPMVVSALADGHKFVRVVVLKSLASQMFQLLVERSSGLANRRIFYMPFSRTAKLDAEKVQLIHNLYTECLHVGGILVAQPEHILSFKLMGIDQQLRATSSGDQSVADALLKSQRWVEAHSRDVLDESDEILHVRYQLVYTVGHQRSLEDHPNRWTTIQQIFSLVWKHAAQIQEEYPLGIEFQENTQGSYPFVRLLLPSAGDALLPLIAKDVLDGVLENGSFGLFPGPVRRAALLFITERNNIPEEDTCLLEEHCKGTGSWNALLLLRGLLVHQILVYVLKERRWRVDYGLDHRRSLLAVPYRAKDVPSLRAEFGHPDVAISLTCLSYYYQGLSHDQLDQCFQLLYKLDNPAVEYENWTRINDSIPRLLRQLSGVNTSDPDQRKRYLYPLFHRNHAVVNFFLSHVVFPKEAKEFPEKLATSGWDLAEKRQNLITGFSGTNDNRYLLPTSMLQDDPIGQLSTNAKVLTFLLQPVNNCYVCAHQNGQYPSATRFLELLVSQTPDIQVLLDVGAQMLELQNAELAEQWLSMKPDIPAAIFFGNNDVPVVLTRDGNVEAFISSPFNEQLDKCLVYLDDAHTRGTDLKLPRHFRAAVTLGPKVTKDRLLQGCMRMRKLGHGQSVMFFAPLEVDRSIRRASRKGASDSIATLDILRWAMLETCNDIERHAPHWAQQGLDYETRRNAWDVYRSSPEPSVEQLRSSWLQPEARALEAMYGWSSTVIGNDLSQHPVFTIPALHERCKMLGVLSFTDTRVEEEQEREVNHEVERERQVERPPKAEAAKHHVRNDVLRWVRTGVIPPNSAQFVSICFPFDQTIPAARNCMWLPNLLTTKDFSTTIQDQTQSSGEYLRPVNWIVSSGSVIVVVSPYEVNELLPKIRRSKNVHLHQYTPRVSQLMKSFDDLKFYCTPPLPSSWAPPGVDLRNQLNLWAGQLYLRDHETYLRLCSFLGLYTKAGEDIPIQHDGFIKPEHRREDSDPLCPFTDSPVPFVKDLIGLRRKGMSYLGTDLGKILHARLLTEEDFL